MNVTRTLIAGLLLSAASICATPGAVPFRPILFSVDEQRAQVVSPDGGRIIITGNNFSDRYIGEGKYRSNSDDPAAGIELVGTRDVAISGNVFSGLNCQAIKADADCPRFDTGGAPLYNSRLLNSAIRID